VRYFLIVLGPALLWIVLVLRISRYRTDRQGDRRKLVSPIDLTWPLHDVLTADNYTPDGQRLLVWLRVSLGLLVVAAILALGLLASAS
jgi:hypothetical protein